MYISLLELLLELYIHLIILLLLIKYANISTMGENIQMNRIYNVHKCIILDDDYELNIVTLFP